MQTEKAGMIAATCPIITAAITLAIWLGIDGQRHGRSMSSGKRNTTRRHGHRMMLAVTISCAASTATAQTRDETFAGGVLRMRQTTAPSASVPQPELPPKASSQNVAQPPVAKSSIQARPRRLPRVDANVQRHDATGGRSAERSLAFATEALAVDAAWSRDWAQSMTTDSCTRRAAEHLDDAYREYSVGAWASAEASAWKALELIATGIDITERQTTVFGDAPSATGDLRSARQAILEARDFVADGAAIDPDRFRAIASSHQTSVFDDGVPAASTATEAVDRYFHYASEKLVPLASCRTSAAQAMDLIAAVLLGRDEADQLPEETALCLRRAAFAGQPTNASLASRLGEQLTAMGLDLEAEYTLHHALDLKPSTETARTLAAVMERRGKRDAAMQLTASLPNEAPADPTAPRTPQVIELSPTEFAAISPPLNTAATPNQALQGSVPPAVAASHSAPAVPAKVAGFRKPNKTSSDVSDRPPIADDGAVAPPAKKSAMGRLIGKFRRFW